MRFKLFAALPDLTGSWIY